MKLLVRLLHFGRSPEEIQAEAREVDVGLAHLREADRKARHQLEEQAERTMTRWAHYDQPKKVGAANGQA